MPEPTCSVCSKMAKRKCTRCGKLFCDLHIRYGNPHFALGSVGGGTGYYCDTCWARYGKWGRVTTLFAVVVIVLIALSAVVALISTFF